METDNREGNAVREFRLEGVGLLLGVGILIVLLGGAFYLGRWYERQVGVPPNAGLAPLEDPLANVAKIEPEADLDESAGYFDDLQGGQKELEPGREVRSARSGAEAGAAEEGRVEEPVATRAEAAPAPEGAFWVQVFAGRDREAAEALVKKLSASDEYHVKIVAEREGRGALYKVRVGGYPTRDEARTVAQKLQQAGYAGAWVATAD